MKALILAAGYATRLYPLTKEYPKPLLKVKGKPIIDFILDKLQDLGPVDQVFVVTNSKFITRFRSWARSKKTKKRITLIDDMTRSESDKRGAIGDLDFAISKKKIRDDLLVIGGDNLFNERLEGFLFLACVKKSPLIGVYELPNLRQASKYGVVRLDKKAKVVDFKEKPSSPRSRLVAMCLYYFPKEKLKLVREYMKSKGKEKDATGSYIDWLRRRVSVYAFVFKGRWYDIGDRKFYSKAKESF